MAMLNMSKLRFGHKLTAALYLIDDYTGQAAERAVTVWIDEHRKAFCKGDGYYLILERERSGKPFQVEVVSPVYQNQTVVIDPAALDRKLPVIRLRLYPTSSYPLAYGTKCLQGTAQPNTKLYFLNAAQDESVKLLYDYTPEQNGCLIFLFSDGQRELEGAVFYLLQQDTGAGECATVAACISRDTCEYQIAVPLKNIYSKTRCAVFPVVTVNTDAQGNYFYPLRSGLNPEDLKPLGK